MSTNRSIATRQRIICKVAEWVWCLGANHFTVDQLAHELGMSKKSIYKNFQSKQELVQEAVQLLITQEKKYIADIQATGQGISIEIANMQAYLLDQWKTVCKSYLQDLHEAFPDAFALYTRQVEESVRKILVKGMKEEFFWPDLEMDIICKLALNQFMQAFKTASQLGKDKSLTQILLYYYQHFFLGICTHTGHQQLVSAFSYVEK